LFIGALVKNCSSPYSNQENLTSLLTSVTIPYKHVDHPLEDQ
jgi:hypothetical protein